MTPRVAPYPTLRSPQYLDYDAVFQDLASKCEVHLIGNILEHRPYAASQNSFPTVLSDLPSAWNNRLTILLSFSPVVCWVVDGLNRISDSLFTKSCSDKITNNKINVLYSFPRPPEHYISTVAKKTGVPLVVEMWEDYAQFGLEIMRTWRLTNTSVFRQTERVYKWMTNISNSADRVIVPTNIF